MKRLYVSIMRNRRPIYNSRSGTLGVQPFESSYSDALYFHNSRVGNLRVIFEMASLLANNYFNG